MNRFRYYSKPFWIRCNARHEFERVFFLLKVCSFSENVHDYGKKDF